jgi:hypothetical protein
VEIYKDLKGNSGVSEYQIGSDWIIVRFKDGDAYKYTYGSAGVSNIEDMKKLARMGSGLNEFINKNVRKRYDSKVP